MRILIIGAMPEEIEKFRQLTNANHHDTLIDIKHYHGYINQHEVIICQSGIGKVNASVTTSTMLHQYNPDLLINIGSAGGIGKSIEIADIIIATELSYHDVDVTAFGYKQGQVPNMPQYYYPNNEIIQTIKNLDHTLRLKFGLILSGDSFINSSTAIKDIHLNFPHALALDMESTSIAQVCHKFNTPFIITRVISDHADNTSDSDFKNQLSVVSDKLATYLAEVIENF
ncbi:5'-methylthioadenosine/adenosylhomocysteine nucleosidase [Thiotrichales bacterium 19S3-7]|nr:5'-methylthioadenosine/adenosylhomocysteine nucleosidase [Thiotrichales bacterium 19S3-7]MCF6801782.1 5'-methylthioadenosine/adenosylhomocysteine nucleosidase [Thiotrichales bacterium 19S3-11]